MSSTNNENYLTHYLGLYETHNVYSYQQYQKAKLDGIKLNPYINSLVKIKDQLEQRQANLNLIFAIVIFLAFLALFITAEQIILSVMIVLRDNINKFNMFRTLGYSDW